MIERVRHGRRAGTFLDLRPLVRSGGEQGLLSLAFSPGYRSDHRFYVSYTDVHGDSRVVAYRSAGGVAVRSSARVILALRQPCSNHNGGQLQFDRRGYLYAGFGDGGSGGDPHENAQNLGTASARSCARGRRIPTAPGRSSRSASATRGGSRSIAGGYVYRGPAVPAARGRYFYGDYCTGTIWSFPVGANGRAGPARVEGHVPGLSSFGEDAAGRLYAGSQAGAGAVYRLE